MGIQINGQTDTISATDGSFTIIGASGDLIGNLTGNVTSSSTSTFSSGLNVTGGSVGIGTDNPTFLLQVQSDDESLARFRRENTGSSQGGIIVGNQTRAIKITGGNDGLIITDNTASQERLRINSSGNIGIGTDNPNYKLHLHSATTGDSNYLQITHVDAGSANTDGLQLGLATGSSPDAYLAQKENADLIFQTNATNRARIDNSGRLLVGTDTANSNFKYGGSGDSATKSQIDGESSSRDVGLALVNHHSSDTQPILRFAKSRGTAASPTAVSNNDYTGSIQFMGYDGTRYIDTARIDSLVNGNPGTDNMPGELIFSTTVSGSSVVAPRMRLSNDAVGYVANLYGTTAWIAATSSGSSGSVVIFACRRSATAVDNGTNVFFVYANGSYGTVSDLNQKKNIESTRDGYLEDLNRLRVVKYNWNDQEDTEPRELGLIAQEVEEVFPGLVSETQEEGEDPIKGIKYSVLPVMLLKALQEADAKIESQATQIASLEARLTALENQ